MENQSNVTSTNLSPRSSGSWWSGHKQRWHWPRKSQQPPKKNDISGPVAEVKRSPPIVLRCLVLAPFSISIFLENCKDSQFWLTLWLPPFEETFICHMMLQKTLWCFNWVSWYPRAQIQPPKKWAWSPSCLWAPNSPRASGRHLWPPSWSKRSKRVRHPRIWVQSCPLMLCIRKNPPVSGAE